MPKGGRYERPFSVPQDVAAELINNVSDVHELPTMLQAVKDTLGAYPEQTLADAGYRSEAVFEALADRTDLVVAIGREGKGTPLRA